MPRVLSADLAEALERPNPAVRPHVTISVPDVEQVFRRPDQWFTAPDEVDITPPGSLVAAQSGALTLASTLTTLSQQTSLSGGGRDLNGETLDTRLRALSFVVDPAFKGVVARQFSAQLSRATFFGGHWPATFSLQVYRATGVGGTLSTPVAGSTTPKTSAWIDWTFTPLLSQEALLRSDQITWDGSNHGWAVFDLSNYRLTLEHKNLPPSSPVNPGELQEYFFRINTTVAMPANSLYTWLWNNSATTQAGVGQFRFVDWQRDSVSDQWVESITHDDGNFHTPAFKLDVETYTPQGVETLLVDLGREPRSDSTGVIVLDASIPPGTSCAAEYSLSGVPTTYQRVVDGDVIGVAQQVYFMRLTLTSTTPFYRAPLVNAFGIRFNSPIDVSNDAVVQYLPQEISVPFCEASIGSATLNVVRSGKRDYEDFATLAAISGPATSLELDIWLGAPSVARSGWFHAERCLFSGRAPSATQEAFTQYSYAKTLKKKIPQRVESINSVHTVATGTTTTAIQVVEPLLNTGTDAYDGAGYYVRVRESVVSYLVGYIATILGNTLTNQLDFASGTFPTALAAGDIIEVHSARYAQGIVSWEDADPADVWADLLALAGVPDQRIGLADLGRGGNAGFPPSVADRAPGDTATQDKLKVTMQVTDPETVDELIDQVSFIMGGATICVAGQIVFVQIYPSRAPDGSVVIPLSNSAVVFDPREFNSVDTPVGLEQRLTVMSCDYGVNKTAANPDATPANTTYFVDADAEAALAPQDLEGLGYSDIDDKISRWCYNAADQGLYLASMLCQQVVLACSTGMRVWSWSSVEQYPELCVGDCVTLVTDQYTDFDPASKQSFSGWYQYQLVLISVTDGGTRFRGYMLGLNASAIRVQGGPGTLGGANAAIDVPDITLTEVRTDQGATGPSAIYIRASWDLIQNPFFDHMEYDVAQLWPDDPLAILTQNVRVVGSKAGPDMIQAVFGLEYTITPITVSTGGTEHAGTPQSIIMSAQIGTVGIASVVAGASSIVWNLTYPAGVTSYAAYWQHFATDPGLVNIEKTGTFYGQFWLTTDPMPIIVVPVDAGNPWGALTLYPFTTLGRSRAYLDRQQRNASATVPSTPATPTLQSNPAGGPIVVRTFYSTGAVAGDVVRLYRDNSVLLSHTLTSGEVAAGHYDFTDSTGVALTTYAFTSTFVAASTGSESLPSAALAVTPPSNTLTTPASFTVTRDPADPLTALFSWVNSGYPTGTRFQLEKSFTGPSSGFSIVTGGNSIAGASFALSVTTAQTWFRILAKNPPFTNSAYAGGSIDAYHGSL